MKRFSAGRRQRRRWAAPNHTYGGREPCPHKERTMIESPLAGFEQDCMQYASYRTYKAQHPGAGHAEALTKGMSADDWQHYEALLHARLAAGARHAPTPAPAGQLNLFTQGRAARATQKTGQPARPQKESMMDRAHHLAWAKARALASVEQEDLADALAFLVSDLGKHPDLRDHKAVEQITVLFLAGSIRTSAYMRTLIEGIN